jgi:chemotaxis methyl-accepting protein methylase
VTPSEFDYLRKLLKDRSGLVLSGDKQYLVESRLLPVAHRCGIADLSELTRRLRGDKAESLVVEVVEAMTTNESFFFPSSISATRSCRRCSPRVPRNAGSASGAPRPRPGRSRTRWP